VSSFLVCCSPIHGHVAPLVALSRALVERGHRVDVLTGRKYADVVAAAGAGFVPLPPEVDYDDADLDAWLPDRTRYRGLARFRHDVIGMFARVIPTQYAAVKAALTSGGYDAVVGESGFTGLIPLLLSTRPADRVPVVALSLGPLMFASVDAAPTGLGLAPMRGRVGRLRNRILNRLVLGGVLRPIQRATDEALAEVGVDPQPGTFGDGLGLFDRVYHLAPGELEYPRRELPASVRFVGPLRIRRSDIPRPSWWSDLDDRRVVHVTQGTLDNEDFTRLVAPTIVALADEDVLVVAATGGRPVEEVLRHFPDGLPANTRIAEMVAYDELLPRCAVFVTNGGFGGVQQALSAGVPAVVAGATEDKPEVAARIAWSGAGINLRTGSPRPRRIRRAVRQVLAEPRYAAAAASFASRARTAPDPVDLIEAELADLIDQHAPRGNIAQPSSGR
jgi:UDP:flavonoid glycosyltransferase YjiC (YdhE family)